MIVDCISDLHGYEPDLPGGDLLIVAGDLCDEVEKKYVFEWWLSKQDYKKRIVIAGNHDRWASSSPLRLDERSEYLCDSGTEFGGLKIWGSPWSPWFKSISPVCMEFVKIDHALKKRWDLIPKDIDILITHCAPYGILDEAGLPRADKHHVGSKSLMKRVLQVKPKYHVFGHIHECNGLFKKNGTLFVNCSHVNEWGIPDNEEIGIEIHGYL